MLTLVGLNVGCFEGLGVVGGEVGENVGRSDGEDVGTWVGYEDTEAKKMLAK